MDGEIQPDELTTALDSDPPLVVDIRQPAAYRRKRIPDSVNVPLPDLTREVEEVADADHVVTVCPHGQASVKAARLISAYEGFDGTVESLDGGLTAWDGPFAGGEVDDEDSAGGQSEDEPIDESARQDSSRSGSR